MLTKHEVNDVPNDRETRSRATSSPQSGSHFAPPDLNALSESLKRFAQWVVWDAIFAEQATAMSQAASDANSYCCVPLDPVSGESVSASDSAVAVPGVVSGASFDAAVRALGANSYTGIGFVLREDDPFSVVSLEEAIAVDGTLTPEAARIVDLLDSYTERSPSGRGIRVFVRGVLPPGGRQRGSIELQESAYFVALTGWRWPGTPDDIADRQREIESLHAEVFPRQAAPGRQARDSAAPPPDSDDDVLATAFGATNGARIRSLFYAEQGAFPVGGDRTAADLALCSLLGFYVGDNPERLDRLFRRSRLYRPRWDMCRYSDGHTYGQAVVAKALEGCLLFYSYPQRASVCTPATESVPTRRADAPESASDTMAARRSDAEEKIRAIDIALQEQVLTAQEAAAILKVSPCLLRRTIKPWRRFGARPCGDRWLLSDLFMQR